MDKKNSSLPAAEIDSKRKADETNTQRVAVAAKSVAEAFIEVENLSQNSKAMDKQLDENRIEDVPATQLCIAKAVKKLVTASECMRLACSHFDWDNMVCYVLDEAIEKLGRALAETYVSADPYAVSENVADSLAKISSALASLATWFTDDEDHDC